jgi:hypothetical protein
MGYDSIDFGMQVFHCRGASPAGRLVLMWVEERRFQI